jgi:ribose transport system permease protein
MLKKATAILTKLRPILILLLVTVVFSMLSDRFFTVGNLTNIFKQISANAILASGVYFTILMGGIDISVGSVLGFSGAMAAYLMVHVDSPWAAALAVAAAIIIGAAAGTANGFFVAKCRLQPMIVTLASLSIFRGATLVLTNGASISINKTAGASAFKLLGQGAVFNDFLPVPIIIMAAIYAVVYYILNKTAYGRHIYAIGGNEDAAYLSGISVAKTKILGFMASGLMAGVAGIIVTARVAAAQPLAGQGYEMDAIAAVVIGGTSLRGGEGHVLYTIIGAVIIGMLNNILNLKDVSSYYQTIIKGGVILAAVLLDAYSKRK